MGPDAVRKAGLVGMGGAGFPTRVKIEPNPRLAKDTLLINGCECEPYITCDYRIMLEWTNQIIAGTKLARKASGCRRVFIAIEDNKPEAIQAFTETLEKTSNTSGINNAQAGSLNINLRNTSDTTNSNSVFLIDLLTILNNQSLNQKCRC